MQHESISATMNGNHKFLGIWQTGRRDGRFGTLYELAHDARRVLEGHWQAVGIIQGDARRSAFAQKEDIITDAQKRLRDIGALTNKFLSMRQEVEKEAAELARVPGYDGDAAQVAIDLELAKYIQAMEPAKRVNQLMMGSDPDLVRAVLRLPTALTGISTSFRAKVLREEIYRREPAKSQDHEDFQGALDNVSSALSAVWKVIAAAGQVDLAKQIESAGNADAAHVVLPRQNSEVISGIAAKVLTSQGE